MINQDLPRLASLKYGFPETPEYVEPRTGFSPLHFRQDQGQSVPLNIVGIEHIAARSFKQKTSRPITDEVTQNLGGSRVNIDVTTT